MQTIARLPTSAARRGLRALPLRSIFPSLMHPCPGDSALSYLAFRRWFIVFRIREPMASRRRWILFLLLAFGVSSPLFAATPEERAFSDASKAFQDTFYDRAEREFGAFVQQFPNSSRAPEAVLFQAEARLMQSNYAGA